MHTGKMVWLVVVTLMLVTTATAVKAEEVMVRKVDNVFYVADTSGSMMTEYGDTGMRDIELAKDLMKRIASRMPDLSYNTCVYQFAEFVEYQKLALYNQKVHERAVGKVTEDGNTWGNDTPIGDGLFELAWPISEAKGPTAVILFTDGGHHTGKRPVPMAWQLYNQYDICIHIVSFAEDEEEFEVIEDLAAVNPCSFVVQASDLLSDPIAVEKFVEDIGWGLRTVMKTIPTPMAEPEPERVYKTVDMELNIEFDFDKYIIRPQYYSELDDLAKVLIANPETEVLIVGHTDNHGSYEYNVTLSHERSTAMKKYLVDTHAIAAERIDIVGYSFSKPKASNETAEGRQRNRRALARISGWYETEPVE